MGHVILITHILVAGVSLQTAEDSPLARRETPAMQVAEGEPASPPGPAPVSAPGVVGAELRTLLPGVVPGVRVRTGTAAFPVFADRPGTGPRSSARRIRVTRPVSGVVTAIDDHTLTLSLDDDGELRFDLQSLPPLELYRGLRRRTVEGALIGGLVLGPPLAYLGVVGTALGGIGCDPGECPENSTYFVMGALFAAVGVGIGALFGAAIETDDWRAVRPQRVRAYVGPGPRGGVSASISLRF
jgi:hypothetical protein